MVIVVVGLLANSYYVVHREEIAPGINRAFFDTPYGDMGRNLILVGNLVMIVGAVLKGAVKFRIMGKVLLGTLLTGFFILSYVILTLFIRPI
jgi:hypothetical protein